MFGLIERWLDKRSEMFLRGIYWVFWTIGLVTLILRYTNLIDATVAVIIGIFSLLLALVFLETYYLHRRIDRSISLIDAVSITFLLLASIVIPALQSK